MHSSFFLIFIVGILTVNGCHQKKALTPPAIEVTAFQLEPETIPADFEYVGVAKSSHPVEIRARVEGYINSIDYIEGSMVKPNDSLFHLDPRPYEASVAEAAGELARQEAILWRAERNLERMVPLYEKNAVSQRDRDNAMAQVLASEAAVISAKANLIKAELNLSYTNVTSPIRGLTSRAIYREGTLITPAINGLLTLVSVIDPIWVDFSVSDSDLLQGRVEKEKHELILPEQENFTVCLELSDGSQFPYQGKVNFASPILDPQTGTMTVRAVFPNPEDQLMPGEFVKAKVSGALRPNALFIPQKSVYQGKKGMYVFVIDEHNKVHSRYVEMGAWYKDYWVVKQGLQQGEIVVADGVNKVQEGSLVKVTSLDKPGKPA